MKAESWHLPEYRCLAPSIRPIAGLHWLHTSLGEFEQRFLYGDGPAQVGFGSLQNLTVYMLTERDTPATHTDT